MHLRVQEVSNFLAVGVLGSGSVRLIRYRGLRARALLPEFLVQLFASVAREPDLNVAPIYYRTVPNRLFDQLSAQGITNPPANRFMRCS